MERAIKLAIEKGGYKGLDGNTGTPSVSGESTINGQSYTAFVRYDEIVLDPAFWRALGKALGWGSWTKTLSEVEHEWTLEKYLPDTAKTPVYACDKCGAQKINNAITIDEEYSDYEVKEGTWTERAVLRRHATYLDDWKHQALRYFELRMTGGDETAFWKGLLNEKV